MYLSRHEAAGGPRWALDGRYLPQDFTLRAAARSGGHGRSRLYRRIILSKRRPKIPSCRP